MTSPSWAQTLWDPASIQQLPETTTWKITICTASGASTAARSCDAIDSYAHASVYSLCRKIAPDSCTFARAFERAVDRSAAAASRSWSARPIVMRLSVSARSAQSLKEKDMQVDQLEV